MAPLPHPSRSVPESCLGPFLPQLWEEDRLGVGQIQAPSLTRDAALDRASVSQLFRRTWRLVLAQCLMSVYWIVRPLGRLNLTPAIVPGWLPVSVSCYCCDSRGGLAGWGWEQGQQKASASTAKPPSCAQSPGMGHCDMTEGSWRWPRLYTIQSRKTGCLGPALFSSTHCSKQVR